MRMDEINLVSADSEITTLDQGAYSQAAAFVSGNAVLAAALDARDQLLTVAAEMLEVDAAALDLKDHRAYVVDDPERHVPLHRIIRYALLRNTPIMGRGSYMPQVDPKREWTHNPYGQQAGTFSFGAFVVEVEVDVETGQVRITRVTGAHDCGFAINPMAVEGQIDGNVGRAGVGASLLEEHFWDGGQVLNANMLEHKLPLSVDMPPVIQRVIVESMDPEGPFGAKEAGLAGAMNLFQAVGNAIYDAIGVWLHEFPMTPERVLEAIERAQEAGDE
jgi:4-hydroxybenzoyl-CoA reductase subunit alpha